LTNREEEFCSFFSAVKYPQIYQLHILTSHFVARILGSQYSAILHMQNFMQKQPLCAELDTCAESVSACRIIQIIGKFLNSVYFSKFLVNPWSIYPNNFTY